ncbi:MAG TPA: SDR family NAD(P)-dependent oxidoreductase [Leptolyngbyaceae cyanobacterium]
MTNRTEQVAMVTGASSGIGRAIAYRLFQEGYRLALCARREDRLQALQNELQAQGAEVLIQKVDLRQEADILAFFQTVRDTWGGVDVLVNNAGVGYRQSLLDGETEAWRAMLEVNVLALSICTREATKDMRAKWGTGHIVHLSSMSAYRVPEGSGMYSATKFAVRSLTEGLRQELRSQGLDIRISSISPGFVETEFAEIFNQSKEKAQEVYSKYPVLQPEDVADAVAYILNQPEHVQVHDLLLRPTRQVS